MTIEFQLDGLIFTAINGGPQFRFNEAVSFLVECKDQAEVDRYRDALLAGGGEPGPCGWLKDRFGLSWHVNWTPPSDMLRDADQETAGRAMQAMLEMGKLDVAAPQWAHVGAQHLPLALRAPQIGRLRHRQHCPLPVNPRSSSGPEGQFSSGVAPGSIAETVWTSISVSVKSRRWSASGASRIDVR